jgi:hypothetical protein
MPGVGKIAFRAWSTGGAVVAGALVGGGVVVGALVAGALVGAGAVAGALVGGALMGAGVVVGALVAGAADVPVGIDVLADGMVGGDELASSLPNASTASRTAITMAAAATTATTASIQERSGSSPGPIVFSSILGFTPPIQARGAAYPSGSTAARVPGQGLPTQVQSSVRIASRTA